MPAALDSTGQRFGRLVATKLVATNERRYACTCDCGNEKVVAGHLLRRGDIRSCGCLRKETGRASLSTHGATGTLTWRRWRSMIARCTIVNGRSYARYGGRGIRVCDRWLASFDNFRADMGECPGAQYTTERNDNDGHYELSNCRWATQAEQNRNTSRAHLLTFNGETLSLTEWGERLGISIRSLLSRLKRGWSVERTLTEPVRCSSRAMRSHCEGNAP